MIALLPRWVVPVVPEGTVLQRHAVVIDGDRIEAVLPIESLNEAYASVERKHLDQHALIPGLINMHTHSAMSLLRGVADDLPLMRWLEDHIWPVEQQLMGPEFVRAGTELAMAEMIRGGTTCFNDNYFFPDATAEAALEVGMRAWVGMPMIHFPTAWAQNEDEYFSRGLAVHDRFKGEDLIGVSFVPHAPYSVSDSAFKRMRVLADQLDLTVHLHLLEAASEIEMSMADHGVHPLDRLGDGMQPAYADGPAGTREVVGCFNMLNVDALLERELVPGRLESCFHSALHRVELLTGGGLIGLVDLAHPLLNRLEPARLGAEELDAGRFEHIDIRGAVERRLGVGRQRVEVGDEVRERHDPKAEGGRRKAGTPSPGQVTPRARP
ncbi:MAG: amidohydrolase family protein [Pseudomonadota bacterium]